MDLTLSWLLVIGVGVAALLVLLMDGSPEPGLVSTALVLARTALLLDAALLINFVAQMLPETTPARGSLAALVAVSVLLAGLLFYFEHRASSAASTRDRTGRSG